MLGNKAEDMLKSHAPPLLSALGLRGRDRHPEAQVCKTEVPLGSPGRNPGSIGSLQSLTSSDPRRLTHSYCQTSPKFLWQAQVKLAKGRIMKVFYLAHVTFCRGLFLGHLGEKKKKKVFDPNAYKKR